MRFKDRALAVFDLQPAEGRSAGLMVGHSFAMGLATVFFETAASALFLARFGSGALPYVYLAAAAVNTVTGIGYTALERRVGFRTLMAGTVALLLASVAGLRVGLAVTDAAWLTFGLLVWYRVLSILTDLEYWAVAARIYDVRQAKRLYGLVGSGEVVARIAGSFAVPLLLKLIGVNDLLVLSAAALAVCFVLVTAVLAGAQEAPPAAARPGAGLEEQRPWARIRALLSDRYLLLIVALAFFGVLGKYFVDFAFLEQMRARYADTKSLASFFAVFSGLSQGLSLLTRSFVSGRLLARHGVRFGLLVLPLAHVACTVLVVAAGGLGSADLVFWLVIANQGIYKTLKHPIDNPSFKVLYQPMRRERRLSAQIAVETLVTPLTIGLAGGVMLLFSTVIPYDPVRFSLVMLVAFAAWAAVALRAGREYAGALLKALRSRVAHDVAFSTRDPESLAILRRTLSSQRPEDVLFALDLIEQGTPEDLPALLEGLLEHPSPAVRRAVLLRLERTRPPRLWDAVVRHALRESDPPVLAAALRCLCAFGGEDVSRRVSPYLDHENAEIRRGALVGLLRAGDATARARLAAAASSTAAPDRSDAARVLGELEDPSLHGLLLPLLADTDPTVRNAALAAAGRLRAEGLWPAVAACLAERRFARAAVSALAAGGEAASRYLTDAFARTARRSLRVRIVRALGRIRGPRAVAFLASRMADSDGRVRREALDALRLCGYRADGTPKEVESLVKQEASDAAWALAVVRDLDGDHEDLALLRSALLAEVDEHRDRLLSLLSFVYDAAAILRARDNLVHRSKERRAYALETLDVTLPAAVRAIVLPLVEDLDVVERLGRLEAHFPRPRLSAEERLLELLSQPDESTRPWIRACALRAAAARPTPAIVEATWRSLGSERALVKEAAAATLWRLGAGFMTEERRGMLTIEKVIHLKAVQMFSRASEEILADIAAVLQEVRVPAGEVVFRKGDVGDSLYIIVEGRVRVYDGDRTVTFLGERDIFGELALLDPEPRLASIEAVADARLLRLDRDAFSELMEDNIEIVRGVLGVLCDRLRRSTAYTDHAPALGLPA